MKIDLQEVTIEAYKQEYHDAIYALLISILENEFQDVPADNFLWDISKIPEVYVMPKGSFWVALHREQVIGTIAVKEDDDENLLARRFFVNPNYRANGIGKMLLNKVLDFGEQSQYNYIFFRGNTKMQQAKNFLAKKNFKEIENISLSVVNIFEMSYPLKKNT